MKEKEMDEVAEMIVGLLKKTTAALVDGKKSRAQVDIDQVALVDISHAAQRLLEKFPLYPEIIIE
jgi:glycine/serine hydroxymethyltransferase